ncbi:MAG: C-GCAxxG-C-C family protein [Thermoguttaceae bacterium]
MSRVERAVRRFAEGFNCSQAILSAYAEHFGLDEETAMKVAAGFGGGMGRMGRTCGAVTGAFMVLGLRFGRSSPDQATKERVYAHIQEFADRFNARNGSLTCKGLLGVDISTPEGHETARKTQLFTTACPRFVRDAAEVLEEILTKPQA